MPNPSAPTRPSAATQDGVEVREQVDTTLEPTWVEGSPNDEPSLGVGTHVGRYSVVRWVGAGAMGEVYAADDPELSRPVALKLMRRRTRRPHSDWVGRARIKREAQALARLSHPNVVPVYDVGIYDDRCFVAMELVHGRTLRRWARAQPRSWTEIVRVMIAAGRGLAAAHGAGLVHRDFKPDNVLIDNDDGRVRVMDFGLARGVDEAEEGKTREISGCDGLTATLTETGSVMGTPGYMSPEQHGGHRVDARGDQYSYCVALFELLYGYRPFPGPTISELAQQKCRGVPRDPRHGPCPGREREIPRWLRRVVARGLAPEPERRWTSMAPLLTALQRGSRPSGRIRWLAAGGLSLTLGGLSAAVAGTPSPCQSGIERVAEVWDKDRKQGLQLAFTRTGRGYANDTYSAVERWVDDYADAWEGLHANTCHAAHERRELATPIHDRRMACLDRGLQRLDAMLAVLETGDAQVLDRAVSAAAALGHPSECRAVRLGGAAPPNAIVASSHRSVRALLARAYAHDQAGDYDQGLQVAQRGLALALDTEDPVLEAEARLRVGHLQQRIRNLREAEAELTQAVWLAEANGEDATAAAAATHLVWLVGDLLDRTEDGLAWARHADSLVARSGNSPIARAHLLESEASVLVDMTRHEQALAKLERAIALREAHQGARHPGLAMAYNNYGSALSTAGRHDEALAQQRRALAIQRVALGPRHPHVGITMTNIGAQLIRRGRYAEADAELRRAHEIFEDSVGIDHPLTAHALNALAGCRVRQHDLQGARALFEEVIEIRKRVLDPRHLEVANALSNLGGLLADLHDDARAREVLEQAVSILEEHRGADHADLAGPLINLAAVELHQGAPLRAQDQLLRAIGLWEDAYGPQHPDLVFALRTLGEVHLVLRDPGATIEVIDRARSLPSQAHHDPAMRAALDLLLAKAMWNAGRDPLRARMLAEGAAEVVETITGLQSEERDAPRLWLAERDTEMKVEGMPHGVLVVEATAATRPRSRGW